MCLKSSYEALAVRQAGNNYLGQRMVMKIETSELS